MSERQAKNISEQVALVEERMQLMQRELERLKFQVSAEEAPPEVGNFSQLLRALASSDDDKGEILRHALTAFPNYSEQAKEGGAGSNQFDAAGSEDKSDTNVDEQAAAKALKQRRAETRARRRKAQAAKRAKELKVAEVANKDGKESEKSVSGKTEAVVLETADEGGAKDDDKAANAAISDSGGAIDAHKSDGSPKSDAPPRLATSKKNLDGVKERNHSAEAKATAGKPTTKKKVEALALEEAKARATAAEKKAVADKIAKAEAVNAAKKTANNRAAQAKQNKNTTEVKSAKGASISGKKAAAKTAPQDNAVDAAANAAERVTAIKIVSGPKSQKAKAISAKRDDDLPPPIDDDILVLTDPLPKR